MGGLFSIFSRNKNYEAKKETVDSVKTDLPAVNDSSMARACFGAGCYWGTEKYFRTEFCKTNPTAAVKGAVGFMGPKTSPSNPSYEDVCTGVTGHVEVYDFHFAGGPEMYEKLVRYFFQFHDPTTLNRQGNDKGTQYASVIFCYDESQYEIAKKVYAQLQGFLDNGEYLGYANKSLATDIRRVSDCSPFFSAHEEHQRYLENHPRGYCNHKLRFKEWPSTEGK